MTFGRVVDVLSLGCYRSVWLVSRVSCLSVAGKPTERKRREKERERASSSTDITRQKQGLYITYKRLGSHYEFTKSKL